mmetsp:Transcript_9030/g.38245  ORF Transcript_9030/g.38245 Transcript_9030/m.38245 type:complete len:303 (-) Transcript_9030:765-1673(-)
MARLEDRPGRSRRVRGGAVVHRDARRVGYVQTFFVGERFFPGEARRARTRRQPGQSCLLPVPGRPRCCESVVRRRRRRRHLGRARARPVRGRRRDRGRVQKEKQKLARRRSQPEHVGRALLLLLCVFRALDWVFVRVRRGALMGVRGLGVVHVHGVPRGVHPQRHQARPRHLRQRLGGPLLLHLPVPGDRLAARAASRRRRRAGGRLRPQQRVLKRARRVFLSSPVFVSGSVTVDKDDRIECRVLCMYAYYLVRRFVWRASPARQKTRVFQTRQTSTAAVSCRRRRRGLLVSASRGACSASW